MTQMMPAISSTALPEAVRSAWHLAALSRQVKRGKSRRVVVCGTPIALFRNDEGVGALVDRCPHRNYPLSAGRVHQGGLECPYHGWRFAADGACLAIPGCTVTSEQAPRLSAEAVRVTERHGAIFVALSDKAPAEPPLPPTLSRNDCDHFWWQQGTWKGRAFDAVENVMDPFHTSHLHHGFIRHRDKRLPVSLEVASDGPTITMTNVQTQPDVGLMSRFLEKERSHSASRYFPPTLVEARWESKRGLTLCVSAFFTPSTDASFMPFARFSSPKGIAPGWMKEAAIRLFLSPVIAQDREALARQHAVMEEFGRPQFVTGPGDILGNRLYRLWKGERLEPGADAPMPTNL